MRTIRVSQRSCKTRSAELNHEVIKITINYGAVSIIIHSPPLSQAGARLLPRDKPSTLKNAKQAGFVNAGKRKVNGSQQKENTQRVPRHGRRKTACSSVFALSLLPVCLPDFLPGPGQIGSAGWMCCAPPSVPFLPPLLRTAIVDVMISEYTKPPPCSQNAECMYRERKHQEGRKKGWNYPSPSVCYTETMCVYVQQFIHSFA